MTYALIALAAIAVLIILILGWYAFVTARTAKRVEKYLPPLGRYMDANGDRIHYVERGDGPPIVMIHGLNGQMRHFSYALQERLDNDYRLVMIDRPGCGYSERKSDDAARVTEQAKSIAEFIKKLGLEKPLIVGHSLGGAVSLALALNHPEVVGGLALVAPLTHGRDVNSEIPPAFKALAITSPFWRKFISRTFSTPASIRNSREILANVFGPEPVPQDIATKGGGLLSLRPKAFYAASTDFLASIVDLPEMVARYNTLNIPFGIIYGTRDRILNCTKNGVAMKDKVANLELELIENAGHMIPMTRPDEVAAFIRRIAGRVFRDSPKSSAVSVSESVRI